MNCIVKVNGREAVPVRAIPYVTGWSLSPDLVVRSFAQPIDSFRRLGDLRAHHISPDGSIGEMLPKEWDGIEDALDALSLELKAKNPDNGITRPEWLNSSVHLLPSHCFVWYDEFVREYHAARTKILFVGERQGDADLNFNPRIPPEHWDAVFEGMSCQKEDMEDMPKTTQESNCLYVSDKLAAMQLAASIFWRNADPSDKTTHRDNAEVEKWLIQHGFSPSSAKSAA